MISAFNLALEFIPLVLAIIAIPLLVSSVKFGVDRACVTLAVIACLILLVSQSGWILIYITNNPLAVTYYDKLWTLFNSLVMLYFILTSKASIK